MIYKNYFTYQIYLTTKNEANHGTQKLSLKIQKLAHFENIYSLPKELKILFPQIIPAV